MIQFLSMAVSANPGTQSLEWLQVAIAIAYYAIPTMLVYSLYKGRDIPFQWMFLILGAFFAACGTAYVVHLWYLRRRQVESALEELAQVLELRVKERTAKLSKANASLTGEIRDRKNAEKALRQSEAQPIAEHQHLQNTRKKLQQTQAQLGQLNQVFMNVISNGIDTLEEVIGTQSRMQNGKDSCSCQLPTIRIQTEVVDRDRVAVKISDNGQGITETVAK